MSTDTATNELDELPTEAEKKGAANAKRRAAAAAKKAESPTKGQKALNAQQQKALDRKVEDTVDEFLEGESSLEAGVEDYRVNGNRRWRCQVDSNRPGVQIFEMMIADPRNPRRPVKVMGKCGVIIEKGLTKVVIDTLKAEYRLKAETQLQDPMAEAGVLHKMIRLKNYTVDVFEEIENPDRVGSIK